MKKSILKLSIVFVLSFCIISSLFSMNCFAAKDDTTLQFSSNKVTVGNNVSVTVRVTGNQMTIASLSISYDSSILKYVSGADNGGAGVVSLVRDFSPTSSQSFTVNFTTIKSGSCRISVSGTKYHGAPPNDEEVAIEGASAPLQVMDAALSTNTNLKSLSVNQGKLSPAFSASRTSYTVNVKNSVTTCQIAATAADSGAKVDIYPANNTQLKVGTNTRTITVTAPSGNTKKYTVNIIRSETDDVVSSDAESTDSSDTESTDPLLIMDGSFASFSVVADLSEITLLKGFSATETEYNGATISVATDEKGEYKLYYLKAPEGDETIICTYDEETKSFSKISYISQGNYTYILADIPDETEIPSSYYITNTKIGEQDIKCYANTSSEDFYYMYCYVNGKYGFYRYDTRESVLQRYPELEPTKTVQTAPVEDEVNILDRFNSLTGNSKIILICLVVVALAVIALIVLLIIKLATKNKNKYFDEDSDDDFEDFAINDNFFITDSEDTDSNKGEE